MVPSIRLKADYWLALCCKPARTDVIVGFLKPETKIISVHKKDCRNLKSIQKERLINLNWEEIIFSKIEQDLEDDPILTELDEIDLMILKHHADMGVDYAAVVARCLGIDRATVFKRHRKLRDLKLLARVQPRMIQYRRNIVDNRWIKHRNHTYYEITDKGNEILKHRK